MERSVREAVRIAGAYAAIGATWVVLSDWVVLGVTPAGLESAVKGVLFVVASGAFVGLLTERSLRRASSLRSDLRGRVEAWNHQSLVGAFLVQDDRLVEANQRLATFLGCDSPEDVVGKPILELIAPEDRSWIAASVTAVPLSEASRELHLLRRDGSRIRVLGQGVQILRDGRPAIAGVAMDATTDGDRAAEVAAYLARIERLLTGTLGIVSKIIEARDPYTDGHQRRVGEIAARIGAELGLSREEADGLRIMGSVHDVGKVGVPAEILTKPGKLSPAEYELVKEHCRKGHAILSALDFPWPLADVALMHHERWDGSGYPLGLQGAQIPFEVRIVSVADAIEAMAAHRPYRAALGVDFALAEITKLCGAAFDPVVVDACVRVYGEQGVPLPT